MTRKDDSGTKKINEKPILIGKIHHTNDATDPLP